MNTALSALTPKHSHIFQHLYLSVFFQHQTWKIQFFYKWQVLSHLEGLHWALNILVERTNSIMKYLTPDAEMSQHITAHYTNKDPPMPSVIIDRDCLILHTPAHTLNLPKRQENGWWKCLVCWAGHAIKGATTYSVLCIQLTSGCKCSPDVQDTDVCTCLYKICGGIQAHAD